MESKVGLWVLVYLRINGVREYPWEGKIMEDRVGRWLVLDPLGLTRNVNKALCSSRGWVNKGEVVDVVEEEEQAAVVVPEPTPAAKQPRSASKPLRQRYSRAKK